MWWNDPKCVHVHIPKTGGTSITAALRSAWARKSLSERVAIRLRLGGKGPAAVRRFHKHAKARDMHAVVGERAWHDHFSFAVVRNPWDLMVSSYHWWLESADRWKNLRTHARAVAALGSFPRFMDSPYGRERIGRAHRQFPRLDLRHRGARVSRYGGPVRTDGAGLAEDHGRLGIQVDLPHLNRGSRGDYLAYYDEPSKQIVAERFAWAIEYFEYRF